MALFNSKSKKDAPKEKAVTATPKASKAKKAPATEKAVAAPAAITILPRAAHVLISARVTEKATDLAQKGVYAFNIKLDANKRQVMDAVKALYKVTPVAVRMISVPRKTVRHPRRGVNGVSKLGKKAYVQLKKGDTISLN